MPEAIACIYTALFWAVLLGSGIAAATASDRTSRTLALPACAGSVLGLGAV